MDDANTGIVDFEATQSHLRAVALRMLGSMAEAEDAVQEAWLRFNRTDTSNIENPSGWLTTVVSRVSLDMLRSRRVRGEEPLAVARAGQVTDNQPGPEQEAIRGDSVAGALLVVLEKLTPPERVAFVLHDLFGVSFDEIGRMVHRTPAAARQLASRARRRVRGADIGGLVDVERQRHVLEAFLRAARRGDVDDLLELLAPDVCLRSDGTATGIDDAPPRVVGAEAVASFFSGRAQTARTALIDGAVGVVVRSEQRLLLLLDITIVQGRITGIDAIADPVRLESAGVEVLAP